MKQGKKLASALAMVLLAAPMVGHAAIIYQTSGGSSSSDWNNAIWGSPAAAPTAGNDYISDGSVGYFRISASGTSSTFGGDSLTVTGSGARALSKEQGTATATINGDFTLDNGAWLDFAPNSGTSLATATLAVNNFIVSGAGVNQLSVGAFTSHSTIDGVLTGAGSLNLYLENAAHATQDQYLTFTSVSGYTGAITVNGRLGIDFGSDYTFNNSITLAGVDSFLNVTNGTTLTFAEGMLSANGQTVAPGTYTADGLAASDANYTSNFIGGGNIVVIPEPATLSLIGVIGGGLLIIRRRFMV